MLLVNNSKIYCALVITFVVFLVMFAIQINKLNNYKITSEVQVVDDMDDYDVYTTACKIPSLSPYSLDVVSSWEFYTKDEKKKCVGKPRLFSSNETHLIFNKQFIKEYAKRVDCYYTEFFRPEPEYHAQLPDAVFAFGKTLKIVDTIPIDFEFIRIQCNSKRDNATVYTDFFSFVPVRGESEEKPIDEDKYNVIVLGIDNVARLGFHRLLGRTVDYLLDHLDAIEFFGYSKVGENTFPNLIPFTTGRTVEEISSNCWEDKGFFDSCDFIWNDFKKMGYATALGEDSANIGLFLYLKKGFYKQPVDHYWNTFNKVALWKIGSNQLNSIQFCLGSVPQYVHLVNYTATYAKTYDEIDRNYFGFFWINSISHDSFVMPAVADKDIVAFLTTISQLKHFKNTFVVLMSDHGYRWYPYRQTYQGKIESNLPALYLVVPETFKTKHPKAYENLKLNSRTLTTPFDLYETLKDIANKNYNPETYDSNRRGISLLKNIPKNRSCHEIGFEPAFCPCVGDQVPVDQVVVHAFVAKSVKYMNKRIEPHDCYPLQLKSILYSSATLLASVYTYKIGFETSPSKAQYEITICCRNNCDDNKFDYCGPTLRIDQYNIPADCVNEEELRNYCMCI